MKIEDFEGIQPGNIINILIGTQVQGLMYLSSWGLYFLCFRTLATGSLHMVAVSQHSPKYNQRLPSPIHHSLWYNITIYYSHLHYPTTRHIMIYLWLQVKFCHLLITLWCVYNLDRIQSEYSICASQGTLHNGICIPKIVFQILTCNTLGSKQHLMKIVFYFKQM